MNILNALDFKYYFLLYVSISYILRFIIIAFEGKSHLLDRIGMPYLLSDPLIAIYSLFCVLLSLFSFLALAPLLFPSTFRAKRILESKLSHTITSSSLDQANKKFILPKLYPRIFFLLLTAVLTYLSATYALGHYISGENSAYEVELNARGEQTISAGSGYFSLFLSLSSLLSCLLATYFRSNFTSLTLGAIYILIYASIGSYRLLFVSSAISFALSWFYLRPQISYNITNKIFRLTFYKKIILASLISILLAGFFIAGTNKELFRSIFWKQAVLTDSSLERGLDFSLGSLTGSTHCIDSLMAIVKIFPWETGGFNFYTGLIRLLIWPIPRQIWPSKPVDTSIISITDFGNFQYLTLGFIGDAYASLGPIGVVFSSILIAYIFARLFIWMGNSSFHKNSFFRAYIYISAISYFSVFLRDGGSSFGVWIIPVFIYGYLFKSFFPRTRV